MLPVKWSEAVIMFDKELLKRIRAKFPRAERDAFDWRRASLDNVIGTLVVGSSAEAKAGAWVD